MPIGFWAISRRDLIEWYKDLYGNEPNREVLNSITNKLPFVLNQALEDFVLPRFAGIEK